MSSVNVEEGWLIDDFGEVVVTRRNGSKHKLSIFDETTETAAAGDTFDHNPGVLVPKSLGLPRVDFTGDFLFVIGGVGGSNLLTEPVPVPVITSI